MMMTMGASHHFLRTRKKAQNSDASETIAGAYHVRYRSFEAEIVVRMQPQRAGRSETGFSADVEHCAVRPTRRVNLPAMGWKRLRQVKFALPWDLDGGERRPEADSDGDASPSAGGVLLLGPMPAPPQLGGIANGIELLRGSALARSTGMGS